MRLASSQNSTVSSPIQHLSNHILDKQIRRSRFRLRLFSCHVQSRVRLTSTFTLHSLILLTISHISHSSNESQSSNTPHSLTLLTNSHSLPTNSQQSKKLSKTLTFSFTLRKLYDIIVLVNQQKLTFDLSSEALFLNASLF